MADKVKGKTQKYSASDKLALALACSAGVMAIILFIIEKTQITLVVLLTLMVVLSIYPIFHFARPKEMRIVLVALTVVGALALGWDEWPQHYKLPKDMTDAEWRQFHQLIGELNVESTTKPGTIPPPPSPEWRAWMRSEIIKKMGVDIGASSTGDCPENSAFVATNNRSVKINDNILVGNGTATCASGSATVEMNGNKAIRPPKN